MTDTPDPYRKYQDAEAALRKSEERAGLLAEALAPFAELGERFSALPDVDVVHVAIPGPDLRRARAALAKEATDG